MSEITQQRLPRISINNGSGGAVEDDHWEAAVAAVLLGVVAGLILYLYVDSRRSSVDIRQIEKAVQLPQ